MFEIVDSVSRNAIIKVIGVGGGGGNAVQHMVERKVEGVDFICANTDVQALETLTAPTLLQLGAGITRGLGAGADPEIGRQAALEDRDRIAQALGEADMLFVTAGMGGGTGTGAAPVIAEVAREQGILTVAVVTKPFVPEGKKRMKVAEEGIVELSRHVNSLITIPNEKLLSLYGESKDLLAAFGHVDDVLLGAVQGIADLIIRPGKINVDFADVRTVMSEKGMAMMGSGRASGESRAEEAAESALRSPLLEDIDFTGAKGVLVNIAGSSNISLGEFSAVCAMVEESASEDATLVTGAVIDESLGDELRVTVVATGIGSQGKVQQRLKMADDEVKKKIAGDGARDYSDFDKPPFLRSSLSGRSGARELPGPEDMDYLDIPAFLRRQVD